jgi:hypothetical protein
MRNTKAAQKEAALKEALKNQRKTSVVGRGAVYPIVVGEMSESEARKIAIERLTAQGWSDIDLDNVKWFADQNQHRFAGKATQPTRGDEEDDE